MLSDFQVTTVVGKLLQREVTMVVSPTATGKSTLIPVAVQKQLSEKKHANVRVVVAVPTRIAAESLAAWVKGQNKNPLIQIDSRFSGKPSLKQANVVYTTAALLMGDYIQALKDRNNPSQFIWDYVIVDEFHTGSLQNSLILSLHRIMTSRYPRYKLTVPGLALLSATPNPIFSYNDVYEQRITLSLPQSTAVQKEPPKTFFLASPVPALEVVTSMIDVIVKICSEKKDKWSILAFVESHHSLDVLFKALLEKKLPRVQLLKAYGGMTGKEREIIFSKIPRGMRRVVIATNVAESSVSVPDVGYVVDSMLYKRPSRGVMGAKVSLETAYIPYSSALQRQARAGRGLVPIQYYYPMITAEEWDEKIKTNPTRIPDIRLVALEKPALHFITSGFNPRNVLEEAGQEAISKTLTNLIDSGMISIKFSKQMDAMKAMRLAEEGLIQESITVTRLGGFWNLFATGLIGALVLWNWLEKGKSPLMGCLVAAIIDSDFTELFPLPENDVKKFTYYNEVLPEYVSNDPLTTILCVVYDFLKDHPMALTLALSFNSIRSWCKSKGLDYSVLKAILVTWKDTASKLNQEKHYNFQELLEISEVVESLIDCLKGEDFFLLERERGRSYRRKNSEIECRLTRSVPYSPYNIPNRLIFLSISESRIGELAPVIRERVGLFVPADFVPRNYYKEKFLLPIRYETQALVFDESSNDVRMPIVQPEDIGLSTDVLAIPISLQLPGNEEQTLIGRRYFMAMYPDMLQMLIYGGSQVQENPFAELFKDLDLSRFVTSAFDFDFDISTDPLFQDLEVTYGNVEAFGLPIEQDFGESVLVY